MSHSSDHIPTFYSYSPTEMEGLKNLGSTGEEVPEHKPLGAFPPNQWMDQLWMWWHRTLYQRLPHPSQEVFKLQGGSQSKKTPPAQKKDSATSTEESRHQEEDTTTQDGQEQD